MGGMSRLLLVVRIECFGIGGVGAQCMLALLYIWLGG